MLIIYEKEKKILHEWQNHNFLLLYQKTEEKKLYRSINIRVSVFVLIFPFSSVFVRYRKTEKIISRKRRNKNLFQAKMYKSWTGWSFLPFFFSSFSLIYLMGFFRLSESRMRTILYSTMLQKKFFFVKFRLSQSWPKICGQFFLMTSFLLHFLWNLWAFFKFHTLNIYVCDWPKTKKKCEKIRWSEMGNENQLFFLLIIIATV